MLSRQSSIVAFAVVAVALTVLEFDIVLGGAGPYKAMHDVQLGTFVGISLGYFVALLVVAWAARYASALASPALRKVTLVALALTAACAVLISPLLAAFALAAGCKTEWLCPSAANPVLWLYLRAVTELPLLPVAAGMVAVIAIAFGSRPRRLGTNEG